MLTLSISVMMVAVGVAMLGFFSIAADAVGAAQMLFVIFLGLSLIAIAAAVRAWADDRPGDHGKPHDRG